MVTASSEIELDAAFAARYSGSTFPAAGGLISYDSYDSKPAYGYRWAGRYAGRILDGDNPADLPVMRPDRFQLVINLKTAKALGITVPPLVLARADEVIQ